MTTLAVARGMVHAQDRFSARTYNGAADPRIPLYPGGLPPPIARRIDAYDAPPPRTNTGLDGGGWTPSSWATAPDASPYAIGSNGARYTHRQDTDSIYDYRRLRWTPVNPLCASADNDWGLNPYADSTPLLREVHAWADEQRKQMHAQGIERFAYPDRSPGLSEVLQRTSARVPRFEEYAPAPVPSGTTPSTWTWTSATLDPVRRGFPVPLKTVPLQMTSDDGRGLGGTGRSSSAGAGGVSRVRADWATPRLQSLQPSQLFY